MAYTAISDIIVPQVFAPYMLEQSLEKNALIKSGLVAMNPALSAALAGGGLTFNFPSFRNADESSTAANVSSSDATSNATPEKMVGRSNIAVRMERNKVWQSTDLTASVAGADPLLALAAQLGDSINKWRTATLFSLLAGVVNETNMASNVNTIASESVSGAGVATKISSGAIIDTLGAWGDMASSAQGVALVMHSDVYRALQKLEPTAFLPLSTTNIFFPAFMGMPVLVDDRYTKRAGTTDGSVYTTFYFKPGALEFGMTPHANAVEPFRAPLAGNGGGAETLSVRDIFTYHVVGTKFTSNTITGDLPTDANLALAANWALAYSAKAVGVAALIHNI